MGELDETTASVDNEDAENPVTVVVNVEGGSDQSDDDQGEVDDLREDIEAWQQETRDQEEMSTLIQAAIASALEQQSQMIQSLQAQVATLESQLVQAINPSASELETAETVETVEVVADESPPEALAEKPQESASRQSWKRMIVRLLT